MLRGPFSPSQATQLSVKVALCNLPVRAGDRNSNPIDLESSLKIASRPAVSLHITHRGTAAVYTYEELNDMTFAFHQHKAVIPVLLLCLEMQRRIL